MLQKSYSIPLAKNHLLISDILAAKFRPLNKHEINAFQGIEGYGQISEFKKDEVDYLLISDSIDEPDYNRRLEGGKIKIEVYCLESEFPLDAIQIFEIDIKERML